MNNRREITKGRKENQVINKVGYVTRENVTSVFLYEMMTITYKIIA